MKTKFPMIFCSVINFCCTTMAPYSLSVGGLDTGVYEIYLCGNTFDIKYAFASAEYHGQEKVIEKRIEEIKKKFAYDSHNILIKSEKNHPKLGLTAPYAGPGVDMFTYKVAFTGNKPKISELQPGFIAYIYITEKSHYLNANPVILGSYKAPTFLSGGERITYLPDDSSRKESALYINVCRDNKLTTYPIARDSVFVVADGKIKFERGGVLECTTTSGEGQFMSKPREICFAKEIKAIEK